MKFYKIADLNGHHHRGGRHRSHNPSSSLTSSVFSPFGFGMTAFDDIFAHATNGNAFTSFSTFNSSLSGPGSANMKSTTTTTRIVNGKKITTKKLVHFCVSCLFFNSYDLYKPVNKSRLKCCSWNEARQLYAKASIRSVFLVLSYLVKHVFF